MHFFNRLTALTTILITLSLPAFAQDKSEGLIGFIEGQLSSPSRIIRLHGVDGSLSAHAKIAEITIADQEGVWLRITKAEIDWTRLALLRGHLQIETLSAESIEISRKPLPDTSLPAPEATELALPELPVSIDITEITAKEVILGEPLFGLAANVSLTASIEMNDAGLQVNLQAKRNDGPGGTLRALIDYSRAEASLGVDVAVTEPANGVIANALNIEGRPSVRAEIAGYGLLADATYDVSLVVDNKRLVKGNVELQEHPEGHELSLNLDGEIAVLVPTDYRPFFAGHSIVAAHGTILKGGGISLPDLSITTADLSLNGSLETAADFFPHAVNLTAEIKREDGASIAIPTGSGQLNLRDAKLDIAFDQANNGAWKVDFTAEDVAFNDMEAKSMSGHAAGLSGMIDDPANRNVSGKVVMEILGLTGEGVANAIAGDTVTANAEWDWQAGKPLFLRTLHLDGDQAKLDVNGQLVGNTLTGTVSGTLDDLSVLSAVSPKPIAGALEFSGEGTVDIKGGKFDVTLSAKGQDISVKDDRIDTLLAGVSSLGGKVRRDTEGLFVQSFLIETDAARIAMTGNLNSDTSNLELNAKLHELSDVLQGFNGPAELSVNATGPFSKLDVTAALATETDMKLDISGTVGKTLDLTGQLVDLPLEVANEFMPNLNIKGLLSGDVTVSGPVATPDVAFTAKGTDINAAPLHSYSVAPLAFNTTGTWGNDGLVLKSLTATGRGSTRVTASGSMSADFQSMDIKTSGKFPVGILSALLAKNNISATGQGSFDLNITGSPTNPSIKGPFRLADGTVHLLKNNVLVNGISLTASMSGQTVTISEMTGHVAEGGNIAATGTIGINGAMPINLKVDANHVKYTDGKMISTSANGNLEVTGNINGAMKVSGDIRLGETEFHIPNETTSTATLANVSHDRPSTPVRRTLRRAGLTLAGTPVGSGGGGDASISLNLHISAPQQIFIRGRGIDAEMGGDITLTGPTTNIHALGGFSLIRGRMKFLDRRLNFTSGTVILSGSMDPQLNFQSSVKADGLQILVQIIGSASAPEIVVTSSPSLPQDEILARLIFARNMGELSPLQILSLASAVSELAGTGGTGLAERLRQASGLDNFDIGQTDSGETDVTVGKYLDNGIYTEVEVTASGGTSVSINLDVMDNVTASGRLSSDGNDSIGIYYEQDY